MIRTPSGRNTISAGRPDQVFQARVSGTDGLGGMRYSLHQRTVCAARQDRCTVIARYCRTGLAVLREHFASRRPVRPACRWRRRRHRPLLVPSRRTVLSAGSGPLRSNAIFSGRTASVTVVARCRQRIRGPHDPPGDLDAARRHAAGEEVGVAQEGGGEARARAARRSSAGAPSCTMRPASRIATSVGQGQRLLLVVGDEDRGQPALALDAAQLDLHVLAQPAVERRERLVEQQHARLASRWRGPARRAAAGRPTVASGRRCSKPVRCTSRSARATSRSRRGAADAAAVAARRRRCRHAHMREQRVGLEHHADVAPPERLVR